MAAVKLLLLSAVLASTMVVCWAKCEELKECPADDIPVAKEIIESCKEDCADPKCKECGNCIGPQCAELSVYKQMMLSGCEKGDSTFAECKRCYGDAMIDCFLSAGLAKE